MSKSKQTVPGSPEPEKEKPSLSGYALILRLEGPDLSVAEDLGNFLSMFVAPKVDQMLANVFSRGILSEYVEGLDFHHLKYYSGIHDQIADAEVKAANPKKKS